MGEPSIIPMYNSIEEPKKSLVSNIKDFLTENYDMRYNVIARGIEIDGKPVNDLMLNSVYVACKSAFKLATKDLVFSIILSDFTKEFNPFLAFIEEYQNEQLKDKNINKLIVSIKTDTPNHDMFIRKWLCSLMASIHGKHSPLMLVLCGGQNTGKTEWFRRLLPEPLRYYYAESKLDGGKDDEILMTKKLIVMDDELGGKSKQEQKKLKEMTSKQTFSIREPYGRVSVDLNRLAMLCGTTNEEQILNDPTGNRRILPINILSIDHELYNSINKCHLFIEAYNLYRSGYDYNLSKNEIEILNNSTVDFIASSAEEELISRCYRVPEENDVNISKLTSTDIINRLKSISHVNISSVKLGLILKKLGFQQVKEKVNGSVIRFYKVLEI